MTVTFFTLNHWTREPLNISHSCATGISCFTVIPVNQTYKHTFLTSSYHFHPVASRRTTMSWSLRTCAEHSASGTLRYTLHLLITSNNDESCACVYVCMRSVWEEVCGMRVEMNASVYNPKAVVYQHVLVALWKTEKGMSGYTLHTTHRSSPLSSLPLLPQ